MRYFKLLFLAVMSIIAIGCEKSVIDNEQSLPEPEVTYEAMDGAWQLTEWRGVALGDQTFLYIAFDDETRRFEMWDNLGSMYTLQRAGTYSISTNTKGEYILCGTYDNGVGDWNAEYVVSIDQEATEMVWRSEDETSIFCRINEIPELD